MIKIKLCGLRRPGDIAAANRLLPDYIGFVFAESRRRVDVETARRLKALLDLRVRAVGVFVNESPQRVAKLCGDGVIDLVQLHGDEDADYIRTLRELTDAPVIKAVRILDRLPPLPQDADYLLFDSHSGAARGGTGQDFPWELVRDCGQPYFLAGGIHSGNVQEAVRTLRPYCIDVSSGIETDGAKDPTKMKELVRLVRSVDE